MNSEREMGEQEKLNEAMKGHLERMKLLGFMLKFVCSFVLMAAGYVTFLMTDFRFGDVPMVLGAYWVYRMLNQPA